MGEKENEAEKLEEGEIRGIEEEVERMGPEEDGRAVRGMGDPRLPTKKEVEEHELIHGGRASG